MRTVKFDKIVMTKLEFTMTGGGEQAVATGVYLDNDGGTHGSTTHRAWSPEVVEALTELRRLMVRDMEMAHFTDVAPAAAEGLQLPLMYGIGEKPEG